MMGVINKKIKKNKKKIKQTHVIGVCNKYFFKDVYIQLVSYLLISYAYEHSVCYVKISLINCDEERKR